jgi:hypothetical protein
MNYFLGRKSAPSPVKAVVTTESSDLRTKIETFECSRVILIATDAQRGKDTNFTARSLKEAITAPSEQWKRPSPPGGTCGVLIAENPEKSIKVSTIRLE